MQGDKGFKDIETESYYLSLLSAFELVTRHSLLPYVSRGGRSVRVAIARRYSSA